MAGQTQPAAPDHLERRGVDHVEVAVGVEVGVGVSVGEGVRVGVFVMVGVTPGSRVAVAVGVGVAA